MADFGTLESWQEVTAAQLGMPVIWLNPNAPRPSARPYATIQITAWDGQRFPAIVGLDDDNESTVTTQYTVSLSLQVYQTATPPFAALRTLQQYRSTLGAPTVWFAYAQQGWGLSTILTGPSDITSIVGTEYESRAVLDMAWLVADTVTDSPGWVDQVNIAETIGNTTYNEEITP